MLSASTKPLSPRCDVDKFVSPMGEVVHSQRDVSYQNLVGPSPISSSYQNSMITIKKEFSSKPQQHDFAHKKQNSSSSENSFDSSFEENTSYRQNNTPAPSSAVVDDLSLGGVPPPPLSPTFTSSQSPSPGYPVSSAQSESSSIASPSGVTSAASASFSESISSNMNSFMHIPYGSTPGMSYCPDTSNNITPVSHPNANSSSNLTFNTLSSNSSGSVSAPLSNGLLSTPGSSIGLSHVSSVNGVYSSAPQTSASTLHMPLSVPSHGDYVPATNLPSLSTSTAPLSTDDIPSNSEQEGEPNSSRRHFSWGHSDIHQLISHVMALRSNNVRKLMDMDRWTEIAEKMSSNLKLTAGACRARFKTLRKDFVAYTELLKEFALINVTNPMDATSSQWSTISKKSQNLAKFRKAPFTHYDRLKLLFSSHDSGDTIDGTNNRGSPGSLSGDEGVDGISEGSNNRRLSSGTGNNQHSQRQTQGQGQGQNQGRQTSSQTGMSGLAEDNQALRSGQAPGFHAHLVNSGTSSNMTNMASMSMVVAMQTTSASTSTSVPPAGAFEPTKYSPVTMYPQQALASTPSNQAQAQYVAHGSQTQTSGQLQQVHQSTGLPYHHVMNSQIGGQYGHHQMLSHPHFNHSQVQGQVQVQNTGHPQSTGHAYTSASGPSQSQVQISTQSQHNQGAGLGAHSQFVGTGMAAGSPSTNTPSNSTHISGQTQTPVPAQVQTQVHPHQVALAQHPPSTQQFMGGYRQSQHPQPAQPPTRNPTQGQGQGQGQFHQNTQISLHGHRPVQPQQPAQVTHYAHQHQHQQHQKHFQQHQQQQQIGLSQTHHPSHHPQMQSQVQVQPQLHVHSQQQIIAQQQQQQMHLQLQQQQQQRPHPPSNFPGFSALHNGQNGQKRPLAENNCEVMASSSSVLGMEPTSGASVSPECNGILADSPDLAKRPRLA